MDFAACVVPAAPVRKKASHKVEMVNQLLFGESMRVIKRKNNWLKVQSLHDNYEGWLRNNLVINIEDKMPADLFVAGELINTITSDGLKIHIPMGSSLPGFCNGAGKLGDFQYGFKGFSFNRNEIKPGENIVRQLTTAWLNAPYLWGGRTPFGVDCSGFVQMVFKMMGLDLLRDAWQQAGQGMKIKKLENVQCGDLAFFDNARGKIIHVGILLSPSAIIHASGKVRIDEIDNKGITNSDTGKRTHSLVAFRRYW